MDYKVSYLKNSIIVKCDGVKSIFRCNFDSYGIKNLTLEDIYLIENHCKNIYNHFDLVPNIYSVKYKVFTPEIGFLKASTKAKIFDSNGLIVDWEKNFPKKGSNVFGHVALIIHGISLNETTKQLSFMIHIYQIKLAKKGEEEEEGDIRCIFN